MATIADRQETVELIDNLTIEWVTPSRAQELIDTIHLVDDTNARKTQGNQVTTLACLILDNMWNPLQDSFKFDKRGILRDGNNRCKAIIEAETPVQVMFLRNCSEEFLAGVDTNVPRNTKMVLEINNTHNPGLTNRALKLQWQYENQYLPGSHSRSRVREDVKPFNTRNIVKYLTSHPRIIDSVRYIENVPGLKGLGSMGDFAWCHYVISNVNPGRRDLVDEYFRRLAQGIYTLPNDALINLRSRLFQHVNSQQHQLKLAAGHAAALTLKGWNLWSQGIEKQIVKWTPDPSNAMTNDPSNHGEMYPHPVQAE